MLSERKIYFWIPLLTEILALYNSILIGFGVRYSYLFCIILGLLFFLRKRILCKSKTYFFSIAIYVVSVVLSSSLFFLSEFNFSVVMGTVIYILPLFYWLLYDDIKVSLYFPQIIMGLKYPVLLVAILGVVQFYISPNLFGIINLSDVVDPYVVIASSDIFSNWVFYLRATSILTSPQVYGLFMVLYAISFFIYARRSVSNLIILSMYLFAGAHSGNKSFFLILLLYGGYYLMKTGGVKSKIGVLFILISLLLVVIYFADEVSFLSRIISVDNFADEEKEGRLSIYKNLLADLSFLGEGAGAHMALSGELSDQPAESYFLQVLIELGIIPFISFLSIFVFNYIKNGKKINIMLFFIALSMGFVHCFNGFVFFIMWGWFFIFPPSINIGKHTVLSYCKKCSV